MALKEPQCHLGLERSVPLSGFVGYEHVIGSNEGERVSFLNFPFFLSFSSFHPHILETSLADRPLKTMELEKAGDFVLRLPELPNDYLNLRDRGNRQTASLRVITWIAAHKARIAQCVVDFRALSTRFYHACHACA